MIGFKHSGNFNNTDKFFRKVTTSNCVRILEKYGREGVVALASATPLDSGETASSWGYEISITNKGAKLIWTNSNIIDGVPVVIVLQYGHATRSGGYVQGRDFINPVIKPIFDKLANDLWREVVNNE